jgi:hypothetical protein
LTPQSAAFFADAYEHGVGANLRNPLIFPRLENA